MEVQTAAPAAAPATPPPAAPAAPAAAAAPTAPAAASPPATTVSAAPPGTNTPAKPVDAPKWTDGFDNDTKEFVTQRGFQDPKAVLDSYRNLEKLRGVPADRLLKIPEPGDEKGMADVFTKLGKPPTPEGYGLTAADPKNPGFTDWAKEHFHKLNLTTEQGRELVKQFNEFSLNAHKAEQDAHNAKVQTARNALQKEWGAAFEQNVNRARSAFRQFGIPETAIDSLEKSIGFDGVMKMFLKMGTSIGEHQYIGGDNSQNFGDVILTPDQATSRIKALKSDPDWSAKYLKGDVKARAEMDRLQRMANPS